MARKTIPLKLPPKRKTAVAKPLTPPKATRSYVKQADIPRIDLAEALRVPQGMWDEFAGKTAAPHQLAQMLNFTPTSGSWDELCGAALAYGLIEGGSRAAQITMTDLARRIVRPTAEGDDLVAKAEAVLRPRIVREFLERYDKAKFPPATIGQNVLAEMGVPKDRAEAVYHLILKNAQSVGMVYSVKNGMYVAIENPIAPRQDDGEDKPDDDTQEVPSESVARPPLTPPNGAKPLMATPASDNNNRVFITHGKNKAVVTQLKELLIYGKFEAVVAEEHETISKPVPDKVIEDMRSCSAGIIHVAAEEVVTDAGGRERNLINENVLIEIGAAMAFYRRNFILLVQDGVQLPSNLQGLYRCDYQGDGLDHAATMKLLKAFNEFTAPGGLKVRA